VDDERSERPTVHRPGAKLDHADTEPAFVEVTPSAPLLDAARRYTFGEEIARGGMGRVVEATDAVLGRKVALKIALATEPESIRRFARETQVTARLEHPSIVPVYDAGKTADGVPFYVMRKVAGRPLSELVRERRTIDERLALLPHVLAAADAVAHAHRRGVLHRDLKPANILVGELGETVVIDWGLAKILDDVSEIAPELGDPALGNDTSLNTRAGQVVGTPGFMAPEQLHGEPATRACDVYALGGTLYHVLAGEPPHAARSSDEMIALALSGPPRKVDELANGAPNELVTIVDRAMAYATADRYVDGAALAAELRRFLTGQLVAAHRYSAVERAIRFVKKYRAALAVLLVALVVLAVVGYLSVTRIVRERNAADDARELALASAQAAEAARAREAERADDLLVSQAAALIATNPTAAVGLLHHLPPTAANWRKARDVLAEARTRGVPWAFRASGYTSGLAVTRDGKIAYSAGNDGVVRAHDLETRTTKELLRGHGSTLLALAAADKLLAIATGSELVWIYSGASDRIALERPIEHLATAGDLAVFHDGRALWAIRHGDRAPTKIEISATKVFGLVAAPDGARIAINAQPEAVVVELSPVPRVILRRPSRSMEPAWSADGKRLAIASLQGLDEIDFTGPPKTQQIAVASSVQAAAYVGEDLYFATGAQTSYRHHPRDGVVQIELPAGVYSSATPSRDGAIFVGASGLVALAGRGGTLTLRGPVPRMFRAVASAQATTFVIAINDHVLLYDAASLLPRMIDTPLANTTFHGFLGNRHYLMGYMLDDWKRFDLATGAESSLGRVEFGAVVDAATDGSYVIARQRDELLVLTTDKPPMQLVDATHAVALTPTKIVFATPHELATMELGPNRRIKLWSTTETIRQLAGAGSFTVAVAQTQLWRRDDRTGTTTTVEWTAAPAALVIDATGNAWIGVEASVWKWAIDGTLSRVGQLSRPIRGLLHVAGTGLVAIDDRRGTTVIVENAPPRSAVPAGYEFTDLARSTPLATGLTQDRRIVVCDLDPSSRHVWSLGTGEDAPEISDDGTRIATYIGGQIAIYSLELPADRTAYEAWLDATTNLRADNATELVWPETP